MVARQGGVDNTRESYRLQTYGWLGWVADGEVCGTTGQSKRVEAIQVDLTGELAEAYDVWYRVHVQGAGWLGWARNGEAAGSEGMSLRAEAVQLALVPEGADHPASDGQSTDVALIGPSNISYSAGDGAGLLTYFCANIDNNDRLGVGYSVHTVDGGWSEAASNGNNVGGGTIDAIRMWPEGEQSSVNNIWYRVYVQGTGWTCWACNGQDAGTLEDGRGIEAVQAHVVSNRQGSPGNGDAAIGFACIGGPYGQTLNSANGWQRSVVDSANSTPWPGVGLCAGWVENVIQNAGLGEYNGNACDLYDWYCHSSDMSDLKVGMIVAVRAHDKTVAGSIWGHVGIYVGDGWVMHSVTSGVTRMPLQDWISYYGATCTPEWGWLGDVALA